MNKLWLAAVMTGVTAIVSMAADDPRIPSGETIRADAVTHGHAQLESFDRTAYGGVLFDGTCYGGDLLTEVAIETLPSGGTLTVDDAMVCTGLGNYWIRRHNAAAMGPMTTYLWAGPYPLHEIAGKYGLAKRLRTEVDAKSGEFLPVGTNEPAPGPNGELPPSLEDGGVLVALRVPARQSADMFTEIATIDPGSGLFWANRTGGFAGVDTWIGPYSVPLLTDVRPSAVRPERIRARKRGRRMNITILREVIGDERVRVRRRDYAPTDIQLGDGIKVLRVLRADRRRVRVRVHIDRKAIRGKRGVRVKGTYAHDLLTLG